MNYNEFIKTYNGRAIDYDGISGVQCVDLAKKYMNKVFGMKPGSWGHAKDYYLNFNSVSALKSNFKRIANTPSFVPQKGDIVVWNKTSSNPYGHIAIATGEGNTKQFYSYDQNYGGKAMHKVLHNYTNFLGVLRPKDQSKITGTTPKPSSKYSAGSYQVTASALRVRAGAGTNYRIVTTIKKGSKQGVDRTSGNWGHLMNNAGWICLDYCKKI